MVIFVDYAKKRPLLQKGHNSSQGRKGRSYASATGAVERITV